MIDPDNTARFIWADKVALALTLLSVATWAFSWSAAFLIIGNLGATSLWSHYGIVGTELGLLGLMAFWLLLRTTDLAGGGSTYGICMQSARDVKAALVRCIGPAGKALHRHEQTGPGQLLNS